MKLFKPLLIFLVLVPFISLAQSNYQPGCVVNIQGDTLRGFINYRGWDSNPTSISFKSNLADNKPQLFTVDNIQFFRINGITAYQKFTCRVSMDETNALRLSTGRDSSSQTETVFLQVLQKGKNVALYAYTDDIKSRYYISEAPGFIPLELTYKIYNNGQTIVDNTYLKQLFELANKYVVLDEDLTQRFNKSGYNQDDLLRIVSKINGISNAEYVKNYADRSQFNLFVSAGLNIANTTSLSSSAYTAGGGVPHTSYGAAASLGFNLIPNVVTHKVEFRAEIGIAESQFNAAYKLKVSPYIGVKASFDELGVFIAPQVIYNVYNSASLRGYLGFGFVYTHFSYSNSFFGSQNPSVSDQGIGAADPFYFNANDNSFLLTAGVKFQRNFEFFFKYRTSTATTGGGYFQLNTVQEQVGFAYFIGK